MSVNICIKCGSKFNTNPVINGVKVRISYNRKYCLSCVPYKANASKIFRIKGKTVICCICGKRYKYNWKGTVNKCRTCYNRERRNNAKESAVKYLGGRCACCGWHRFIEALTFHHKDPQKKKFTISQTNVISMSWRRLKEELDKCVLLCANCHIGVHTGHLEVKDEN